MKTNLPASEIFKEWCHRRIDEILKNAVLKIKGMKNTRYRSRPVEEIWATGELFTAACVKYHQNGDYEPVARGLHEMARRRIQDGFDPREVLSAMMMWKRAAMEKAMEDFSESPDDLRAVLLSIEEIMERVIPDLGYFLHQEAMKEAAKGRPRGGPLDKPSSEHTARSWGKLL